MSKKPISCDFRPRVLKTEMDDIFMSFGQPGDDGYSGNIGFAYGGVVLSLWRNGTHGGTDEQRMYIPEKNLTQVMRALAVALERK